MNPKIQLALWIAHPLLQLSVAAVMFYRKLHKIFPVFFAYIVSQILIFAVLFPMFQLGYAHYYVCMYWTCTAISLAVGFKVIHEIFLDIFRPYHTLKDLGSVLFKWAALVMLLWRYFDPYNRGYPFQVSDVLLPLIVLLIVLVIFHILIVLLLPVRWAAIRGEFQRRLQRRVESELKSMYAAIPADVAAGLRLERRHIEELLKDTREVTAWLEQREQAASIEALYGK